jgi:F0F1-type ATP synthase membrane subunit b/b'
MKETLHQLVVLLRGSLPTIAIVVALHFWLRKFLYRPLQRTLDERRLRTEGKMAQARQSISRAEANLTAYEQAMAAARADSYRAIEERRRGAAEQRLKLLTEARAQAEAAMQRARQEISTDVEAARESLRETSQSVAGELVDKILTPTAPEVSA